MQILIIDNYDSFTYNLYQQVAKLVMPEGGNVRVVRNDQISIAQIIDMPPTGIILSPGPGGPKDTGICGGILKNLSGKVPILGVCLGHQLIAWQNGAEVSRANLAVHGKCSRIYHNRSGLFKDLPSPFRVARYHSLIVHRSTLPAEFSLDAQTIDGQVMAISHKKLPLWGLQFHPESFMTEYGDLLMKKFLDFCKITITKNFHEREVRAIN